MLTMNELFSGIGAQTTALKRLEIEHKVVGISDIDKYANQSYMAIHGQTRQYGDISKINRLDYADLWTYSFPCQDLSNAGKQAGIHEGTRSGLLLEVERLLEKAVEEGTKPKYLLLENVKALVSKKFMPDFQRWLNKLEQLGYRNYWKVLNAKDYGVPQNRERVFVVSIRNDIEKQFVFPEKIPLTKRLKDVLETNVDEKYYLSDDKVARFINITQDISHTIRVGGRGTYDKKHCWDVVCCASIGRNPDNPSDRTSGIQTEPIIAQKVGDRNKDANYSFHNYSNTIPANPMSDRGQILIEPQVKQLGNIVDTGNWDNPQRCRIYDSNGCSPALNTVGGGGLEPKVIVEGHFNYPNSEKQHQSNTVISKDGISTTLDTMAGGNLQPKITEVICSTQKNAYHGNGEISPTLTSAMGMGGGQTPMCKYENLRIRKLTPKECWRLMGFNDLEFTLAQLSGISNSQLYKQAGNSIVVDVLVAIFKNLFKKGE